MSDGSVNKSGRAGCEQSRCGVDARGGEKGDSSSKNGCTSREGEWLVWGMLDGWWLVWGMLNREGLVWGMLNREGLVWGMLEGW